MSRISQAGAVLLLLALPGQAAPAQSGWVKMPLLTPAAKKAGVFPGGEGGQWPRGPVAVSPADPNFLLLAIDVGGLYRSLDGGKNWQSAMVGWDARGANGFAIDPKNADHVLGMGGNSMTWDAGWGPSPHGVYLSTDKAGSWKHVLAAPNAFFGVVAFDPASYDPQKHICTRAYYLPNSTGLFKSEDGGETWKAAAKLAVGAPGRDWTLGGGLPDMLKITPQGLLYAAGAQGLFRSDDHGQTFTLLRTDEIYGLGVTPGGAVYVSGAFGVQVSQDGGKTFASLPCRGLVRPDGGPVNEIEVSPVDPRRMMVWVTSVPKKGDYNFDWPRFLSQDGGTTWQKIKLDNTGATLPLDGRQGYSIWSPTDAHVAYSIGGDWVTKSTDGGKTFHWANNGDNGIMLGGLFNFNARTPDTIYLGFQDYNGAFTTDGGRIWNYRFVSGMFWGGQQYGGFALNRQVMWSGDAGDSWTAPRRLRLTRDGGTTWNFVNGPDGKPLVWSGPDVSAGDPADPQVGFASNYRTGDGGKTWQPMPGCDGVFITGPITKALYGKKGDAVVRSADHGVTWQKVADVEGGFADLAVDEKTNTVYAASQDSLKAWHAGVWTTHETPKDQFGSSRVWTVATDPQQPSIVYVGGPRNTYASHATVCRSLDGGLTWENLTVNAPLTGRSSAGAGAGPHEVSAIRVHPVTREAWVAGQCYGLWRFPPPKPGEKGVPAAEASAPPAIAPPTVAVETSPPH